MSDGLSLYLIGLIRCLYVIELSALCLTVRGTEVCVFGMDRKLATCFATFASRISLYALYAPPNTGSLISCWVFSPSLSDCEDSQRENLVLPSCRLCSDSVSDPGDFSGSDST